jgi:hypothetical protein
MSAAAIEPIIPLCVADASICSGYLLPDVICPRTGGLGCALLKNPKYRLVNGDEAIA